MPMKQLLQYLDEQGIKYVTIRHSERFTAQEIAAATHIPGKELAKTVIVDLDGKMAMVVLPASERVDFAKLADMTGTRNVKLATEEQFAGLFPGCELGAMPPFGNLWNMEVYVSEILTEDEEIAFNAGTHTELLKLAFSDFERLVHPKVVSFA